MAGATKSLTPPNPDFASWESINGTTHRLRIVAEDDDGKRVPVPALIAMATISAFGEMARGGDPVEVLKAFGPYLTIRDANGLDIWPPAPAKVETSAPPAPRKPGRPKKKKGITVEASP